MTTNNLSAVISREQGSVREVQFKKEDRVAQDSLDGKSMAQRRGIETMSASKKAEATTYRKIKLLAEDIRLGNLSSSQKQKDMMIAEHEPYRRLIINDIYVDLWRGVSRDYVRVWKDMGLALGGLISSKTFWRWESDAKYDEIVETICRDMNVSNPLMDTRLVVRRTRK